MRDGSEQLFQGNCTLIYGGPNKGKYHIHIYSLVSTVLFMNVFKTRHSGVLRPLVVLQCRKCYLTFNNST